MIALPLNWLIAEIDWSQYVKKCVVIYNPESGYKKNKINLELVESILNTSEYNVIFLKTTKKGDAKNYMLNL